ncbi:hypothetical protein A0H81_05003 [Grifola frondosa]|uniref:Chromo domain-containing protein n=1 Tax=Grifola frondosa TaxID=5627 RepID=A0A1C7MJB6_GRIFR|nr:hypothetical protein A0H81_05003 [Grifola frondosa]
MLSSPMLPSPRRLAPPTRFDAPQKQSSRQVGARQAYDGTNHWHMMESTRSVFATNVTRYCTLAGAMALTHNELDILRPKVYPTISTPRSQPASTSLIDFQLHNANVTGIPIYAATSAPRALLESKMVDPFETVFEWSGLKVIRVQISWPAYPDVVHEIDLAVRTEDSRRATAFITRIEVAMAIAEHFAGFVDKTMNRRVTPHNEDWAFVPGAIYALWLVALHHTQGNVFQAQVRYTKDILVGPRAFLGNFFVNGLRFKTSRIKPSNLQTCAFELTKTTNVDLDAMSDSEEDQYVVECIWSAKVVRVARQKAWWKNYEKEHNTWEPVASFDGGAEHFLETFWARVDAGGRDYHDLTQFAVGEEVFPTGPPRRTTYVQRLSSVFEDRSCGSIRVSKRASSSKRPLIKKDTCSCGHCLDGWLSSRMRVRMGRTAESLFLTTEYILETRTGENDPVPIGFIICDTALRYLPADMYSVMTRAFCYGFLSVLRLIMDITCDPDVAKGVPTTDAIWTYIDELQEHGVDPEEPPYFEPGMFKEFRDGGGRIEYALNCIVDRSFEDSPVGSEFDDDKKEMEEELEDDYPGLPRCANDLDFDMARRKLGLSKERKGPYFDFAKRIWYTLDGRPGITAPP